MSDKKDKNSFYDASVKLLANKFMKAMENPEEELVRLHEGLEKTYEMWAEKFVSEEGLKEDVWIEFMTQVKGKKKNG